jgi:hypothetical protein
MSIHDEHPTDHDPSTPDDGLVDDCPLCELLRAEIAAGKAVVVDLSTFDASERRRMRNRRKSARKARRRG